ncbi:MAG: 7TM diverse intracellular signaling domain-containing protein [Burkholderiaceae bacterium]
MTLAEVALWSACLGVFALCFVVSLAQALVMRSALGLQLAAFVSALGLFVATGSGWLAAMHTGLSAQTLQKLTLFSGPVSACIATLGLRQFLRAYQRDAWVQITLLVSAVAAAIAAGAVFWPHDGQALQAVAVVDLGCSVLALVLTLRAYWQGDHFARPMAWACVALIFAVVGIHAMALRATDGNLAFQAVSAIAIVGYLIGSGLAIWRQNTAYLRMRRALSLHQKKDLLTQLWTGEALVQRLDKTITRAQRNRTETAIVCIQVFNAAQLRQDLGDNAVEQLIYNFASRVRHNAGSSNELGRYDDNSFVVLVENVRQPSALRTLGLRLAGGTRRPYMINPRSSAPRQFSADIGVGIARLAAGGDVRMTRPLGAEVPYSPEGVSAAQAAMVDAHALAKAAQKMPSRVAILDAYSRKAVAIEDADLM